MCFKLTYLFALFINDLIRHIQEQVRWCILFADDIVLIDQTIAEIDYILELWKEALESKGFKVSRRQKSKGLVTIPGE